MARFNAGAKTLSINTTTTFTYAFTGGLITLGGASGYTVTIANPAYSPGQTQNFYNSTAGNVTISAGSYNISGPGFVTATSQNIPAGAFYSFTSNGSSYIITNDEGGILYATTGTFLNDVTGSGFAQFGTIQGGSLGSATLTIKSTSSSTKATAGVLMTDNITSSTTTTGTLVVTGGVGVSENIRSGGTIYGNLNSTSVTLTGGSIDGTTVGSTTRSSGAFTSLGANGAVTIQTTTNNQSYTTTGAGTITITSGTTGNIDNIAIGNSTRAAGNFTTLNANSTVTLSPSNAGVTISPSGSGNVVISPATAGTIDNVAIGNSTRQGGSFTVLNANNTVTFTAGGSATTSGTGTIRVTGGIGLTGDVFADGNVTYNRVERVESSTGYYLVNTDVGKYIYMNNGSSGTVYVPADSRSTIPVGAIIWIYRGNSTLTLAAEGGVSVSATGAFNTSEELYIRKRASNNWVVGHGVVGGSISSSVGGVTAGTYTGNKYFNMTGGTYTASFT